MVKTKKVIREIVLDTETTGLEPKNGDRLTEIGAIELINHIPTGRIYHQYINPEREIPQDIIKINGLTNDFLKDFPTFKEIAKDFMDFVGTDSFLIAHDIFWDMSFINNELKLLGYAELEEKRFIDTLEIAKNKFSEQRNDLSGLCERFQMDENKYDLKGTLRAARLLADVYSNLFDNFVENIDVKTEYPPFLQAILDNKLYKAEKFYINGIDINMSDKDGHTATYFAIFSQNLNMLKWVLRKGGSANYVDPLTGATLLHMASGEGHLDMVQYLIKKYNVDVNALDNKNETPLENSLIFTQMAVANYLVEHGAMNKGKISHLGALLKYLKSKKEELETDKRFEQKDWKKAFERTKNNQDMFTYLSSRHKNCLKYYDSRISLLKKFIKNNDWKANTAKSSVSLDSEIKKILLKLGMKNKNEIKFYLKMLNNEQKQKLLTLYKNNPKDNNIRNIIWACYLGKWVTRFYTSDHVIEPAYMIPFDEEIFNNEICEVDANSFIQTISSYFPKFGRDYYLVKIKNKKTGFWFSLPHDACYSPFWGISMETTVAPVAQMNNDESYRIMRYIMGYISDELLKLDIEKLILKSDKYHYDITSY